jgi:hypothetical protein
MTAITRRVFFALAIAAAITAGMTGGNARAERMAPEQVVQTWYKLVLELVRHTSNYSPPVASRSFAYLGVTAYESVASGREDLRSLAGQLNALKPLPRREQGATYDDAVVLDAALAFSIEQFFNRTGPTGRHVLKKMTARMRDRVSEGLPEDVVTRSREHGLAIAKAVLDWSRTDGGDDVQNMGFPLEYQLKKGPGFWAPTSLIRQQQAPLLPNWGNNRPFAMPESASCRLPAPPQYSEDKASVFYREAEEVRVTVSQITPERKTVARFWSDDPMLSPTPPGHWISIALQIFERDQSDLETRVDTLARLGVAVADAFIGCWDTKFEFNLIRPVTYIKKVMDPKWEALLITPPFPEYPSGHSTQSGAAASVLTHVFGDNFAFDDATHEKDGIAPRHFTSFDQAAREAAISRLYGGIHFRSAIEQGLEQGECIAAHVNALKTRN